MVKNILVTGSNGYIGTVLVSLLKKRGYNITGWDTDFFKKNVLGKYKDPIKSVQLDVRKNLAELKNIDCIIHLAALSNDPMGALDEKLTLDINYKATIALAKKAKKAGVKRFIMSSSCSVYGIAKKDVVNEKSKVNPLTAYAKSKVLSENKLKKLASKDFCVCLLRNATVCGYSPRFRDDLVVNNLVSSGLVTEEIKVLSDGTPWRPLIDVRDLSEIMCQFVEAEPKSVNNKIFNIGFSNSNYQVNDILKAVKKSLPKCQIIYTGEHGKDSRSYKVDFSKMFKLFPNLKQQWPLEKSVSDLVKRLKKEKFKKSDFEYGKYNRLKSLQQLLSAKKIDKNLFWRV